MPEAARGKSDSFSGETVDTVHPATGDVDTEDSSFCDEDPINTTTNECSTKVLVEGTGAVRVGNKVTAHPIGGTCSTHTPIFNSGTSVVLIEGVNSARKGDTYECSAEIKTGSSKVKFGDAPA